MYNALWTVLTIECCDIWKVPQERNCQACTVTSADQRLLVEAMNEALTHTITLVCLDISVTQIHTHTHIYTYRHTVAVPSPIEWHVFLIFINRLHNIYIITKIQTFLHIHNAAYKWNETCTKNDTSQGNWMQHYWWQMLCCYVCYYSGVQLLRVERIGNFIRIEYRIE